MSYQLINKVKLLANPKPILLLINHSLLCSGETAVQISVEGTLAYGLIMSLNHKYQMVSGFGFLEWYGRCLKNCSLISSRFETVLKRVLLKGRLMYYLF
jgi:hypothetical protein